MNFKLDFSNIISSNIGEEHGIKFSDIEALAKNTNIFNSLEEKIKNETLGFYNLPFDKDVLEEVKSYTELAKERFTHYVNIGIGGSALGPIALQSSLNSYYYNDSSFPKMYYPDNVDPDWLAELIEQIDVSKTLFHVVSKSGGTAETAATLLYIMDFLRERLGDNFYKNLL